MVEIFEETAFRNMSKVFDDRFHAGELLAEKLVEYKDEKDVYLLAIPAGGVPIAFIISQILNVHLDLAVTRKLHIP